MTQMKYQKLPVAPLPNLVDDFLHAANPLKFAAITLAMWHRRFTDTGAKIANHELTFLEQHALSTYVDAIVAADKAYVTAHDNFIAARKAAKHHTKIDHDNPPPRQ